MVAASDVYARIGDVVIRRARESDLPQVIQVNRKCLPENYPEWFFEDHLRNWGKAFYVAEAPRGKIVGYVMTRVEYGVGFVARGFVKRGHIISLAVLPEYRRRGIATKLMEAAMDSLKREYGAQEVYLEVRVSNTPAIKLYEKLGFRKIHVIPRYYFDGEDAYLMARLL
ncbi:ribosomal-protein-alanine acetyltransferase [Pyrolobus fumarii 1A]|uniref:N-alpha-acetyltransferase n=1 Tax=Pyrolobus fumarii (strain DSM 11204 / 1A) TaxID=694429 RepID=G0ECA4_PYRF1|nr:ribosomal-protein-alanine acetyltransferase [Pyrolobus fumarii 1A]